MERYLLMIYFSYIKKNQEGVYRITPWNMNSNPNKTVILPVNALLIYIFHTPRSLWGVENIFLVRTSITGTKRRLVSS